MGYTTLLNGSKQFKTLNGLPTQQREFVLALLASDTFDPREAAEKAGYSKPKHASQRLMKDPHIKELLERCIAEREDRTGKKADDIIHFLHGALYLDPVEFFQKNDFSGGFEIKNLDQIPKALRIYINSIDVRENTDRDGNVTKWYKIKLMPKEVLLQLALKHHGLLETKVKVEGTVNINWDGMKIKNVPHNADDTVEQQILDVEFEVEQKRLESQ